MKEEQKLFVRKIQQHWFLRNVFNSDVCLFIACQFALESAFGNSTLAVSHHNFCGMKTPAKRYGKYLLSFPACHTNQPKLGEFAWYDNLDDCVIDYVCWVLYFRPSLTNLSSACQYAAWIDKKFCPEKDYVDNIISLYNQFNHA